jgi:hypothetical protein
VKILDKYFKFAMYVEWAGFLIITALSLYISKVGSFKQPLEDSCINLASDISGAALTCAGFFLTILTLLVSFKNTFREVERIDESQSLFKTFFSIKSLYKETITQMKSCIFNSVMIAGLVFTSRMVLINEFSTYLFPIVSGSFFLLCASNFRCLLILNRVISLDDN